MRAARRGRWKAHKVSLSLLVLPDSGPGNLLPSPTPTFTPSPFGHRLRPCRYTQVPLRGALCHRQLPLLGSLLPFSQPLSPDGVGMEWSGERAGKTIRLSWLRGGSQRDGDWGQAEEETAPALVPLGGPLAAPCPPHMPSAPGAFASLGGSVLEAPLPPPWNVAKPGLRKGRACV